MRPFLIYILIWSCSLSAACQSKNQITFRITLDQTNQSLHVVMNIPEAKRDTILLKLPAWTPGYYQLLHFADHVSNFKASTLSGANLYVKRHQRNGWKVAVQKGEAFVVEYDIKATRSFVATPYVDSNRAYISPPGVFMHVAGQISNAASVTLELPIGWKAATGLEPASANAASFTAPDFDVLYDSPILMGPLEELPAFTVQGIPHRFIGYNLGNFDRTTFMSDLKKIVESSVQVIGDIPYKHYTFIAIGPGPGGIEHLNSTTFGFSGESLNSPEGKKRMYTFLAHEYFHHYNVKRIRPVELGPFNYDEGSRTNMLWVSEGFTVYYDLLVTRRAGLMSTDDLLESYRNRLLGYENKPGRLFQSATQASYNTWTDGPFGRTSDEVNKTVSVYDKGAILGLMLDLNIRHVTKNSRSLDDVMRTLYKEFYQEKKRGFTEQEFQAVCEKVAGTKLTELFTYASTTQSIDYKKYFAYGGLDIDSELKPLPGGWLGISSRIKNDTLFITNVDYESPGWNAGLRRQMVILKNTDQPIEPVLKNQKAGDQVTLQILNKGNVQDFNITLVTKMEASFKITPLNNPTALQEKIFKAWLTNAGVEH